MGLPKQMTGAGSPYPSSDGEVRELAGMPLERLREEIRHELFQQFVPFMNRYVIDHEQGGFQCQLNPDGTHPDNDKNTWFQGRGLWVYSYLYNHFGHDPEYLAVARKTFDLIMRSKPSGKDQMWPAKLSREGKPLTAPQMTIGADVSIAEGLAEYSKATGDIQFWNLAKEILLKCVRQYDRPDYAPNVVAQYHGPKPVNFPGARTQGVAMILTGTITQVLEMHPDAELERIIGNCVDAVINRHFNPEFQLNNELLNHDYSRPANELAQFVYTGHCIETLAIILFEAVRTQNGNLFRTAAERLQRHVEVAWDEVYGGAFRSLNNVDEDHWEVNKVLWAQEETLNGCLLVIDYAGAPWARELYARTYHYIRSTYYVPRWSYSFWISGGDRKVTVQPNLERVEHYHHPKNLMHSLLVLDRLIGRGGKISPLFAPSARDDGREVPLSKKA